jgi:protein-S-isoprenylcysteine O-methyltransferase Ste14
VVLAALLGGLPPELAFDSPEADRRVTAGGIIVALLGQALRVAVIGLAYIRRGGRHGRVYAARLVTQGIFAHCRNPLYVGNLLVLLGLFLVHGNAWACALGMAFFAFAYRAIVAAEEAYLHERFGVEYERYCAQVNRWLPDFRGLRRSLEGMRFDWARVVAKEYGSTAAWTAALLVLMAVKTVRIEGAANHPVRLAVLAALVVMVGVGFLAARVWKKSRADVADTTVVHHAS